MILQKLASAIRRQDWFQVVIEVLIVIVGIFLGLQVQEWNDTRANRAQSTIYVEQLIEDLKADFEIYKMASEQIVRVKKTHLERVETLILTGEKLPIITDNIFGNAVNVDTFGSLELSTIMSWRFLPVRSSTYDDLQNSGKFSNISDRNLRLAISEYYTASNNARERVLARIPGYGAALYSLIEADARTAFGHNFSEFNMTLSQDTAFDESKLISFIERARNEDFQALMRAEKNYTEFVNLVSTEQVKRIEVLLNLLEGQASD